MIPETSAEVQRARAAVAEAEKLVRAKRAKLIKLGAWEELDQDAYERVLAALDRRDWASAYKIIREVWL